MKLSPVVVLSIGISFAVHAYPPITEKEKQFIETIGNPRPTKLSLRDYEEMRAYGWHLYHEGSMMKDDVLLALTVIGDRDARKLTVVAVTKEPRGHLGRSLARAGNPILLPDMAPVLFVEEEMRNIGSEDGWAFPSSYTIGLTILETLGNSGLFNEEVINWARRFKGEMPTPEIRDIMRDWWKENEKLILDENYKAVKPGRDLAIPPVVTETVVVPIDAPPSATPSPAAAESAKTEKPPEAPVETRQVSPAKSNSWLAFGILGGCIALLIMGVMAARPRQN